MLPDVVRLTFKAFHDVLRVQGESIKSLERALDSKASRSEVSLALQSRASGVEMAARFAEASGMVLGQKLAMHGSGASMLQPVVGNDLYPYHISA